MSFRFTALVVAFGCIVLNACSIAPGMRLSGPMRHAASEQAEVAQADETPASVTEIDAKSIREQARQKQQQTQRAFDDLSGAAHPYTVGPADVLQITVWDHPELAAAGGATQTTTPRPADAPAGFVVDPDGFVQFPYVGRIKAVGLDVSMIQSRLQRALTPYFRNPQVTVRVASYRSKQVLVDGEVHAPGALQMNDVPMTLTEAIGRAGGFTPAADQGRLTLLRGDHAWHLSIPSIIAHGHNPKDIMLRHGDVLRITSRDQSSVYVMGEVAKPVTAIPKQDGSLSLADALSQAGSLNMSTSNPQQLYVVRGAQDDHPEVFHLDARSPVSMVLAGRFQLQPDDVVYVDATDLVRINRVLSLLLPAINAAMTGAVVSK